MVQRGRVGGASGKKPSSQKPKLNAVVKHSFAEQEAQILRGELNVNYNYPGDHRRLTSVGAIRDPIILIQSKRSEPIRVNFVEELLSKPMRDISTSVLEQSLPRLQGALEQQPALRSIITTISNELVRRKKK